MNAPKLTQTDREEEKMCWEGGEILPFWMASSFQRGEHFSDGSKIRWERHFKQVREADWRCSAFPHQIKGINSQTLRKQQGNKSIRYITLSNVLLLVWCKHGVTGSRSFPEVIHVSLCLFIMLRSIAYVPGQPCQRLNPHVTSNSPCTQQYVCRVNTHRRGSRRDYNDVLVMTVILVVIAHQ